VHHRIRQHWLRYCDLLQYLAPGKLSQQVLSSYSQHLLTSPQDDNECYTGNFTVDQLNDTLAETINTAVSGVSLVNPYGIIPNPFYQSSSAGSAISSQENIFGTDGGYSGQGIPIFPWLQPFRAIDIIFVIDAATQPPSNITNGTSISNTYTSAQAKGLTRMPLVPTPEQVVSQNLSSRAQFYGCHNTSVATVVYLPNSVLGDIPSAFSFTEEEVDAAIEGGTAMVTQSQDGQDAGEWAACLACVIVHKNVTDLPEVCTGCLERYCWPREGGEEDGADGGSGGEEPSATTTGAGGGASETAAAGAGNVIRGSAGLLVVCAVATLAMLM
jgi:lysophospholipase